MGELANLFDEPDDDAKARAGINLRFGVDAQPDVAARNNALARRFGLPAGVVEQYKPEYEARARVADAMPVLEQSPALRGWLAADANRAKVAHDDVGLLGSIETTVAAAARYVMGADDRGGLPADVGQFGRALAAGMVPRFGAAAYGAAAYPLEALGLTGAGSQLRNLQRQSNAEADAWRGSLEDAGLIRRGVMAGAESAGQTMVTLPLGFMRGAAVTGEQAMLAAMGALTFGQTYGKARDKGLSVGQAGLYGMQDAAAEVVTEKFLGAAKMVADAKAGSSLVRLFMRDVAREIPGESAATVWQNFNEWANLNPDKRLAEWLAEQPAAIAETIVATIVGAGAQTGAIRAVQRATGDRDRQQAIAAATDQRAQALVELSTLSEASKLRERDPDEFLSLVEKQASEGGLPHIYVDAQVLQQSGIDIQAAAQALPSVAAQIEQAIATGGDLVIPTSEFLTLAAGQPFAAGIIENARTRPDAMSAAEAKAYMAERGDSLQAEIDAVMGRRETDQATEDARGALRDGFARQLQAAGRQPQAAQQEAALLEAFFTVNGQRMGMTGTELAQRYQVQVQGKMAEGAAVYEQGAKDAAAELLIQHNLTAENLLHAKRMGGIPVPSLAVTKKTSPMGSFGEITLIGEKGMADPKGYAGTKVFGADIYSPRYPSVEFKLDNKAQRAFNAALDKFRKDGDREMYAGEIRRPDDITSYKPFKRWAADRYGIADQDLTWQQLKESAAALMRQIGAGERIFQGFTYSGNRRYIDHTLDNVVKILKKELRGGENFNYGVGSLRAKFTPQFRSIEQMRKAKGRLMDKASFEAVKKEIDGEFVALAESLDLSLEQTSEVIEDAAKMGAKRAIARAFKDYKRGESDATDEQAIAVGDFARKLVDLPTEYFEAKILRAVDLAEFAAAVVPVDASQDVLDALAERGVKRVAKYDPSVEGDRTAKINEFGDLFFQSAAAKTPRAQVAFHANLTDAPSIITLLQGADLSSFIHEAGHFFLQAQVDMAARIEAQQQSGASITAGEQQILADARVVLDWFGIKGTEQTSALTEWLAMPLEQQREHHEKWARGFESYAFEGKSPSIELQGAFQRFRAWMLQVYKSLAKLNVTLTDEVRGVMDRMLASEQQIAEAEAARRMGPLFETAEQAGMTPEQFDAYHAQALDATQEAIQNLQARGLRDMKWLSNAKSRKLKELQKTTDGLRRQTRMEVRAEVMAEPVYRAWQFLTGKGEKQDQADPAVIEKVGKSLDPSRDSLLVAIAKIGGINRDSARVDLGVHHDDHNTDSGVFGMPVFRKEGGKSSEHMVESLTESGYMLQGEGLRELEERIGDELRGDLQYSTWHDWATSMGDEPVQSLRPEALFGKLHTGILRDRYGTKPDAIWRTLSALRMTSEERGVDPDVVAETFGFTSGDEMIQALAVADPPNKVIEERTDQRMLEQHGDLATPEGLKRAVDDALQTEARARFIATELEALERANRVREKVKGQRSTVDVLAKAARSYAQGLVARLRVRDIRPQQYQAAEARASKAAQKAMTAGDTAEAAAQKRNQLIQHAAARAASEAQAEVEQARAYFGRFNKRIKALDASYQDQIDALLEKFDFRRQSDNTAERRASMRTWVQARLNDGEIPDIAETLLSADERAAYLAAVQSRDADGELVYRDDESAVQLLADAIDRSARRPYRDMTVEELRGLVDTIKHIEHLGRLKGRMLTTRGRQAYEAVRDEMAASVVDNASAGGKNKRTATDWLGARLQSLSQFAASHIKVSSWARRMDGGQDNGAVWRYLVMPANERASMETTMRAQATQALDDILRPVLAKVGAMDKVGKGRFFATINDSLNWQERFTMALNVGNESNLQRLLGGKGWSMEQVLPVLRSLSAQEWRAVQAVWDHFESYRPQIGAKERRVNGKEPRWIDARPFDVTTADGQTISLRGGYYPVKFDPRVNQRAGQHSAAEEAKTLLSKAYSAATTRRSFVKNRVDEVRGRPLLLSLQGLYSGINDVIHDLAWHEWVIDANRLLKSDKLDGAIREHYGPEVKKEFERWRDDIVAGTARADHAVETAARWARQSVTASALTFNLVSAAMQPLGLANSISRVGAHWIGRGVMRYIGSPIASTREAQDLSPWLANRTRTRFRELNELRNQIQGQTAAKELMGRYGYWMMMRTQLMVDVPTWWGAYEKALAGGLEEDTAIAVADQAVKDAQGGGEEVDQSGVERGGPLVKLFTAFYGFMGTTLNVAYLNATTEKNRAKMAVNAILVLAVPAILGSLLKDALIPGDAGDEEDLAKKLAAEQISFLMGTVAFGREFAQAGKVLLGEGGGMGYSGPAGLRLIPDTIKLSQQAAQGEFDDAFRKAFVNVAGDLTGIPSVQINRTITGAQALADGKTANPAALAFGFQESR